MKIPRDISGEELARLLKKYGYEVTRQKGSHIRLTGFVILHDVQHKFCILIPAYRQAGLIFTFLSSVVPPHLCIGAG